MKKNENRRRGCAACFALHEFFTIVEMLLNRLDRQSPLFAEARMLLPCYLSVAKMRKI